MQLTQDAYVLLLLYLLYDYSYKLFVIKWKPHYLWGAIHKKRDLKMWGFGREINKRHHNIFKMTENKGVHIKLEAL